MKIYLDNCCFNRPFDDQSQIVVHLETRAKLHIQEQIRKGLHELVWSYMLDFEISKNPYEAHKQAIASWYDPAAEKILKSNEDMSLLQNLKYNFWKNCKKVDDCNL